MKSIQVELSSLAVKCTVVLLEKVSSRVDRSNSISYVCAWTTAERSLASSLVMFVPDTGALLVIQNGGCV